MIDAAFQGLSQQDKVALVPFVIAPLKSALAAFAAGKMGERELIAIEMAVNQTVRELLPAHSYGVMAERTIEALRARLAEMDAEVPS